LKGQREYYRHAAVYPEVSGKIPPRRDNLELDEHKYLLQVEPARRSLDEGGSETSNLSAEASAKEEVKSEKEGMHSSMHPFIHSDKKNNKPKESLNDYYFSEVFNVAYGGNTTLNQLYSALRDNLAKFDKKIANIKPEYGPFRVGDIPHSQASILKAKTILGYEPEYDAKEGFELAAEWYYKNLQ